MLIRALHLRTTAVFLLQPTYKPGRRLKRLGLRYHRCQEVAQQTQLCCLCSELLTRVVGSSIRLAAYITPKPSLSITLILNRQWAAHRKAARRRTRQRRLVVLRPAYRTAHDPYVRYRWLWHNRLRRILRLVVLSCVLAYAVRPLRHRSLGEYQLG
jgi:hypothetical protein